MENKKYYIEQISSSKAYQFTSHYHYSGVGFKKAKINLGVFCKENDLLVGVLQWGCSAQEGIRLDRYVKEPINKEEYLELNRFCMADSEGKNSESQAISLAIKWLKKNKPEIKLLVSYAGRKEGNYGFIYQATNWEYLGYFISNGFWEIDGKEKHQITLWYHYQKYGNTKLPFKDALCEMYSSVKQTASKQFIYIYRLDNTLTPASPVLSYPKESNEYPIRTDVSVYKDEPYITETDNKEMPKFYYDPSELLFSRRALIRQGVIVKEHIAAYDGNGDLELTTPTITEMANELDITQSTISSAIKSGKIACGYYFRRFPSNQEPEAKIDVPWLCKIDGIKFARQTYIADYCGVSRQAVSQAVKRQSKEIAGKIILWNKDNFIDKP